AEYGVMWPASCVNVPVTIVNPLPPILSSIDPGSVFLGTQPTITLTGANFGSSPQVCINGLSSCAQPGGTISFNGGTITQLTCSSSCDSSIRIAVIVTETAPLATILISVLAAGQASQALGFQLKQLASVTQTPCCIDMTVNDTSTIALSF